jgi:flagellar basal-body rod protein FlgG
MANLSTPGYQSAQVGFQDLLYSSGGPAATGTSDATGAGATAQIVGRNQSEGSLENTGRSLDVAINGPGYLEVRRDDGTIGLTRNGSLELDSQGQLTDQTGNPLVPPITVPKGADVNSLHITAAGEVSLNGKQLGKINVVNVPAPNQLQPDGDSVFSVTAGSGAMQTASGSTVQQGFLEDSNVDISADMTQMIAAQSDYQMDGQALQYQDQMLQTANQLRSGS